MTPFWATFVTVLVWSLNFDYRTYEIEWSSDWRRVWPQFAAMLLSDVLVSLVSAGFIYAAWSAALD